MGKIFPVEQNRDGNEAKVNMARGNMRSLGDCQSTTELTTFEMQCVYGGSNSVNVEALIGGGVGAVTTPIIYINKMKVTRSGSPKTPTMMIMVAAAGGFVLGAVATSVIDAVVKDLYDKYIG